MLPLKIITDSTCDLSTDLFDRYDVEVVSAKLTKDMTTSHPSPYDFVQSYRSHPDNFILSVHLSSKFSATYNAACQAQEQVDPQGLRIKVIDSGSVSAGLGFFVLALARFVEQIQDLSRVLSQIEKIRDRVHFDFFLDNPQNLNKSGRLGRLPVPSPISQKLHFLPFFSCQKSQMAYTNTFNFQDALEKIAHKITQISNFQEIIVAHSCEEKIYRLFVDLLQRELKSVTVHHCILNDILKAHVGEGAFGVAYLT